MEFTLDVATLRQEVNLLQGIAEKKAGVAALSSLLIEASDQEIKLTASDLDTTLKTSVKASVKKEGSLCIPAQKLSDIVRSVEKGSITLKQEANNWTRITAGPSKFRVQGISVDQYPEIEISSGSTVELDGGAFIDMVDKTSFAITLEPSRFTLSGANLTVSDGKAVMAATDGHRIAVASLEIEDADAEFEILIPKKTLAEVCRMAGKTLVITDCKNQIVFTSGKRTIVSRKLTGTFPDYKLALPKNNNTKFSISSDALGKALRRVAISADDLNFSVKLDIAADKLTLSSSGDGESEEVIKIDAVGVPETGKKVHLNWKYMADFLGVTKKVTIAVGGATDPLDIREGDSIYIQVPLREA